MTSGGELPCIDCGEPTLNPERCRDCDLEYLSATWPKCACGARLYRVESARALGITEAHAFDCALRPRRAIFCGSRHWTDARPIEAALKALPRHSVVLHGACPTGADAFAHLLATRLKLPVERFPADWKRYGLRAGPIRNAAMLASGADLVEAFWDGESRGTGGMIKIAEAAGVEVRVTRR